jgi:uncharacterized phage-associated protein
MSYLRLLKLLYIADRESLQTGNRPIVGTRPVAMKNGPLHSKVLDLINQRDIDEPKWSRFIQRQGYEVVLVRDPGVSELSRFEIDLLNRVARDHSNMDDWELVEHTHTFGEWKECYQEDTSSTIRVEDILAALNVSPGDKDEILNDLREDCELNRLTLSISRE